MSRPWCLIEEGELVWFRKAVVQFVVPPQLVFGEQLAGRRQPLLDEGAILAVHGSDDGIAVPLVNNPDQVVGDLFGIEEFG